MSVGKFVKGMGEELRGRGRFGTREREREERVGKITR
jgi:hypothetical protein